MQMVDPASVMGNRSPFRLITNNYIDHEHLYALLSLTDIVTVTVLFVLFVQIPVSQLPQVD